MLRPCQRRTPEWGCDSTELRNTHILFAVIGIDIGKHSFHVVGHDDRGSIVLRQKWTRGQIDARLANLPPCLMPPMVLVMAAQIGRACTP